MTLTECLNRIEQDCYNPKTKKDFIVSHYADNINVAWTYYLTFKNLFKFEQFYAKDVSLFTRHQLMSVFETNMSPPSTFDEICRRLKNYFKFCNRAFFDLNYDQLDVYDMVTVSSFRDSYDFISLIKSAFHQDAEKTMDVVRKTCIILLYLGINKNDIVRLKKDDVDCLNGKINIPFDDRVIDIYYILPEECVDTIRLCKEMSDYNTPFGKRELIDSDLLIRGDSTSDTESSGVLFIEKIFRKSLKDCDKNLNPTKVLESGFYYWMYKKELELGRPFEVSEFKEHTTVFFGKTLKKYMHYFQNYVSWKRAYNYN